MRCRGGCFTRTNFSDSDLRDVNFTYANILETNFDHANLLGVNMEIEAVIKEDAQIHCMSLSSDDRSLLIGLSNKTLKLLDLELKRTLSILRKHTGTVMTVEFSQDYTLIGSGGGDKRVAIWKTVTGEIVAEFLGHSAPVKHLYFRVVVCTYSQGVTIKLKDLGYSELD